MREGRGKIKKKLLGFLPVPKLLLSKSELNQPPESRVPTEMIQNKIDANSVITTILFSPLRVSSDFIGFLYSGDNTAAILGPRVDEH